MLNPGGARPTNASTLIRTIHVEILNLPLYEPFTIATGQFETANNVLVRVELENGVIGLGEASPTNSSGGETLGTIHACLHEMIPHVTGCDVANWRAIAEFLQSQFAAQSCARAGMEMAILDAYTRSINIPLYRYFGGATNNVETDLTIPISIPDHARELALKAVTRGIRTLKIKLQGIISDDEACIAAIRTGAPNSMIILDANQSYNVPDALRLLELLERHNIRPILFEQPLPRDDWHGMTMLTSRSPVLIAADELVRTPADAIRVVEERAAHVINIKLTKFTYLGALDIIGICRAAKIGLMIGTMIESRLGTAGAAHLAAGVGGFRFIDLDMPMLINAELFHGGYTQTGARYDLSEIRGGHGVERW
jgi:L-alanine-DL-glutamate epimerase-like enolase superfamily enzyme